jgi:hypothetical protein
MTNSNELGISLSPISQQGIGSAEINGLVAYDEV